MSYSISSTRKRDSSTSFDVGVVNIAKANEHTAGQSGNTRIINTTIFSGLAFAAMMAFMNLGSPTTTNQSNMSNSQQNVSPATLRSKKTHVDTEENSDGNIIATSQKLQEYFGFKTAQWAKILKVERKTIYNWKNNTDTRVKADAARRVMALSDFAKVFKADHALFFSKFVFGSKANEELASVLHKDSLDLKEISNAYFKIYTEIDGYIKRKRLLG